MDFAVSSEDYNILPSHREAEAIMTGAPVAEWSVDLPATPDYRSHTTYVVPELTLPGAYLVTASMRADFKDDVNYMVAENFLLSDLVLVTRAVTGGYEVTARSGETGRALEGVDVSLYGYDYRRGHREMERKKSGPDGVVEFSTRSWNREQYFILARNGVDLALDANRLYQQYDGSRGTSSAALIYTDRSVYRPQQTLHWKAVAYKGGGEKIEYRTLPDTALKVSLIDANGEEVASADATTNSFGSASGSFDIPAGRLLGQWSLRTSVGGQTWLRVEEYKRPTFEVTVGDPEAPLRLNREAELSGDVKYYFGLPVVTGSVDWRVTREPIYPRWWYWWYPSASAQSQVVAAGETSLDDEGRFSIQFVPEADEREAERGVTYRYRLGVDVTDEGGETRSAERIFRLGFVAVEARIIDDHGFHTADAASIVRVVRTDLDGTPRAGEGSWRLVRLEQPDDVLMPADQPLPRPPGGREGYETPGDRLRPRWDPSYDPNAVLGQWAEGEELATGAVTHGEDGVAELSLPGLDAGAYRVVYTTRDEFGAEFTTSEQVVVAGARRTPLALPEFLRFDRSTVGVGEMARLFVFTGLRAQEMVLEVYRDGQRVERREIGAGRSGVVDFPISAGDRGGFAVALTMVRDHQVVRQTARVFVPWDDRELEIDFATFRDRMRPGTRETFTVTVRNRDGGAVDPAAAELLAYMYDRSLDIFAPHMPPSVASLYPDRTAMGQMWTNLGLAQQAWGRSNGLGLPGYPHLHGDSLMVLNGYGIGGPGRRGRFQAIKAGMVSEGMELRMADSPAPSSMAMDAVAESKAEGEMGQNLQRSDKDAVAGGGEPESSVELRSDFSETAFWEPHVVLSADGSATVEFEVPDSVTDWNLWVHAVTTDLRGGSTTRQAQSVKELMVRPYLPRFLREGDRAVLKVVVNNAGEEAFTGALNLAINDPGNW